MTTKSQIKATTDTRIGEKIIARPTPLPWPIPRPPRPFPVLGKACGSLLAHLLR